MKNYMKEVAELLGVELNEEFEIIFPTSPECYATVKLTVDGTKVINTNVFDVFNFKSYLLEHLIKGSYSIKRKPWKPKTNDGYYCIGKDGNVINGFWCNNLFDHTLYKIGNCYKTIEEAKENKDAWKTFYNSDEILVL